MRRQKRIEYESLPQDIKVSLARGLSMQVAALFDHVTKLTTQVEELQSKCVCPSIIFEALDKFEERLDKLKVSK